MPIFIEDYNNNDSYIIESQKCYENGSAYSGPNLPLIPEHACHLFRRKAATHSGWNLPFLKFFSGIKNKPFPFKTEPAYLIKN